MANEPREIQPITMFNTGPEHDKNFNVNVERVTHQHPVSAPEPEAEAPRGPAPDAEPVPTPSTPTPRPDGEPPSPDHLTPATGVQADLLAQTMPADMLSEVGVDS